MLKSKKWMMLAVVACCHFVCNGAEPAISQGNGFEHCAIGFYELNQPDRQGGTEVYFTSDAEDPRYEVCAYGGDAYDGTGGYPAGFSGIGDKYLSFKTTLGSPLCRTVNPIASDSSVLPLVIGDDLCFDMIVKLTPFDEHPEFRKPAALAKSAGKSMIVSGHGGIMVAPPGASIAIDDKMLLYFFEDEETEQVGLYLLAGGLETPESIPTVERYTLTVEGTTPSVENWHRVTIRTVKDASTAGANVLGFQVLIDNKLATSGSRTTFAAYGSGSIPAHEFTFVAFDGQGCVDDISITLESQPTLPVYCVKREDGTWGWDAEKCTVSQVEYMSWREYAASEGLDWTDSSNWSLWNPGRTGVVQCGNASYWLDLWNRAHIGWLDSDGMHRRLEGRRFDPRNPGIGTDISSAAIKSVVDQALASTLDNEADTDNDGLPDILEVELGTNPFEFDTDGDGLPDGYEIMMSCTDPLKVFSAVGVPDAKRNYDGDAMAISSYQLEKGVLPLPRDVDRAKRVTFAVVDPSGDSGGVQWYATSEMPTIEVTTNENAVWRFAIAGRHYVSYEKPLVLEDGVRLAKALDKANTFLSDGEAVPLRGWPVCISAGTLIDAASLSDEPVDVGVVTLASNITEKQANACWIYGKGIAKGRFGEVAATAADYGCLALGRQQSAARGSVICAMPSDERDVAFLHYLVYQEFGFDPRTAWSARSPLAERWSSGAGQDEVFVLDRTRKQGRFAGVSTRTRDYCTYDEFLLHSFFLNNGCDMSCPLTTSGDMLPVTRVWMAFTTDPYGPNEPDCGMAKASTNGADTDYDGVPDGWELYVMSGPKKNGGYVFSPAYGGVNTASFSPFVALSKTGNATDNKNSAGDGDGLTEFQEFEGTDSTSCYSSYSSTIVHDSSWNWINKYFPTDPWNADTDGDGMSEYAERRSFAYGAPADDGKLRSVPGGGLNPCSVDTDCDGLPDPWETQFAGKTQYAGSNAVVWNNGAQVVDFARDKDGNEIGNALQGLVDGMDGTVADAFNYPITRSAQDGSVKEFVRINGVAQVVNRDYDQDGLENWQEYLTGTMRCWRYDDPFSAWKPIPDEWYWTEELQQTANETHLVKVWKPETHFKNDFGIDTSAADGGWGEFWYKTLVDRTSAIYNPRLAGGSSNGSLYFSRLANGWDAAYVDSSDNSAMGCAYYWFYDRIDNVALSDLWSNRIPLGSKPSKYACCSPIESDSDKDGMDDYYELFHGMNPLLGQSGVLKAAGGPCDLVCDAWVSDCAVAFEAWGSGETMNYWQLNPWKTPRVNDGFDFEVYPWLNGLASADADGDDIRNQQEAIVPPLAPASWYHTDPTPLWMTDSTDANSLTRRFFRLPTRFNAIEVGGDTFVYNEATFRFSDYADWLRSEWFASARVAPFVPDYWKLAADGKMNWICSFEENEGFDTDHDGIGDYDELAGYYRAATDPKDADSPRRRQAMYFGGAEHPSALQTLPRDPARHPVAGRGWPSEAILVRYTAEVWVKPEELNDATVLERVVQDSLTLLYDGDFLYRTFYLGMRKRTNGVYWCAGLSAPIIDTVEVLSQGYASADKWTHLAVAYDGTCLSLYVDGHCQGEVSVPKFSPSFESPSTIIVGASAKSRADGATDALHVDVTNGRGWGQYTRFFKGWIDEVRIWDGARTSQEIRADKNVRYDAVLAKDNRNEVYFNWMKGQRRALSAGEEDLLPPELLYHWSFDSVFGAQNKQAVAQIPRGYNGLHATLARPEGYSVPWWQKILAGYTGAVYRDERLVPWIPNTVAHLPRLDGSTLDSVFWSIGSKGGVSGNYQFENTAEPYARWTQFTRNAAETCADYCSTGTRHVRLNASDEFGYACAEFEFSGRNRCQSGDDLIALGGAYARTSDETVGLWDEQGPSDPWEVTGLDSNQNGFPDWWEKYAEENYIEGIVDFLDRFTVVNYHGVSTSALEAYLSDLDKGFYEDEYGHVVASYIVEFDVGEHGSLADATKQTQRVRVGADAVEPEVMADFGWRFDGWDGEFSNVKSDLVVTAQWTHVEATVKDEVGDDKTWYLGDTYERAVTSPVVQDGMRLVLVRWSAREEESAELIATDTNTTIRFDLENVGPYVVVTEWATNYWLEVLAATNGNLFGVESGWKPAGTTPRLGAVPDKGFVLKGWFGDIDGCSLSDGGDEITVPMTKPRNVGAEFSRKVYTVAFDSNGGVCGTVSRSVEDGAAIGSMPEATLKGRMFCGWFTARDGGELVTAETVVSSDVTCYAHWQRMVQDLPPWSEADIVTQDDTMIVYAVVSNRQTKARIESEGSLLAAFADNGELRGVAEVAYSETRGWRYQLSIAVTSSFEKGFSLKVWDASTGEITDIDEGVNCNSEMQIGTFKEPHAYVVGALECQVALKEGWNWISPSVKLENASIGAAFAGITFAEDDVVKSSGKVATYCDGQWNPSTFRLEPGVAYMVRKSAGGSEDVTFVGEAAANSVVVKAGWNWIGSTSLATQPVTCVTHSVGFVEDDVLKSASRSTTYCDGMWQPSTFEVAPGVGYKTRIAEAGVLTFGENASTKAAFAKSALFAAKTVGLSASAVTAPWTSEDVVTQYDTMIVYLKVSNNVQKAWVEADGSVVAAFASNGECRGCATVEETARGKLYQLSVGVTSSSEGGFVIKVWDAATGKVHVLQGFLACNESKTIGEFKSPHVMALVAETPIPPLPPNPNSEDVYQALEGSIDPRLQERITTPEEYEDFRVWSAMVKVPGGVAMAGAQAVVDSPNAWLSYALDADALIETAPTEGDIKIETFVPTQVEGLFELAVSIKGAPVGNDAKPSNLAKLFGIEGGQTFKGMSSENVEVSFESPENGKVRIHAGPKDGKASAFFMKVNLTQ